MQYKAFPKKITNVLLREANISNKAVKDKHQVVMIFFLFNLPYFIQKKLPGKLTNHFLSLEALSRDTFLGNLYSYKQYS